MKTILPKAAALALTAMMFVACGPSYDVPTALDSWKSDANGTVKGAEISVTAGRL